LFSVLLSSPLFTSTAPLVSLSLGFSHPLSFQRFVFLCWLLLAYFLSPPFFLVKFWFAPAYSLPLVAEEKRM
jgi:hypothetical protein